MASNNSSKANAKNKLEEKEREIAIALYKTRLSHLKHAQKFVKEDKMNAAVDSYLKYLTILANYFSTTEEKLTPNLFDATKDITELLLISHAYWDLAKAYDRSPNLQKDCLRSLDQFIKFSIGFRYQHVNAQIVRKFNHEKKAHNPQAFDNAYQRIQVQSKKCYLATMHYGESHPHVTLLRSFKNSLSNYYLGAKFIDSYYFFSPRIVNYLEERLFLKKIFSFFVLSPIFFFIIPLVGLYVNHHKNHCTRLD